MSAEPLLFLPGLLCDAALWSAQIEALQGVAAPVVADLTLDDNIAAMAVRALDAMPPRFAVCGLSMGGYVAFEIVRRARHRVTRLCLIASAAAADTAAQARKRRALMALTRQHPKFIGVSPRLLPELLHPDNLGDAALAAAMGAMAQRVGRAAFLRQEQAILDRVDSREELGLIEVPTLLLVGEADRVTPPEATAAMGAAMPDAVVRVLAGCGHLPPLERPALVSAALLDWLRAERTVS